MAMVSVVYVALVFVGYTGVIDGVKEFIDDCIQGPTCQDCRGELEGSDECDAIENICLEEDEQAKDTVDCHECYMTYYRANGCSYKLGECIETGYGIAGKITCRFCDSNNYMEHSCEEFLLAECCNLGYLPDGHASDTTVPTATQGWFTLGHGNPDPTCEECCGINFHTVECEDILLECIPC